MHSFQNILKYEDLLKKYSSFSMTRWCTSMVFKQFNVSIQSINANIGKTIRIGTKMETNSYDFPHRTNWFELCVVWALALIRRETSIQTLGQISPTKGSMQKIFLRRLSFTRFLAKTLRVNKIEKFLKESVIRSRL